MRSHTSLSKDHDANAAAKEAAKGAMYGATKWGLLAAVLGGAGYAMSPIYRGLTVQFKVFIQMSGMVLGGMIEADRRLREFEGAMRRKRKMEASQRVWNLEAVPRGEGGKSTRNDGDR